MDVLFVLDPLGSLIAPHDTTVAIMEAAQRRGHAVWVATMADLDVDGGMAHASAERIAIEPAALEAGRWRASPDWWHVVESARRVVGSFAAVFIRTDPPFDDDYLRGTYLLDLVDHERTLMINSPSGIREANEKLFALRFPELGPETLVSRDADQIIARVDAWGKAVLKPTNSMGGRGILVLRPDDENLRSILETATARGRQHVVIQRWIDAVTTEGDRRVILLGGRPVGAVRRVATTDFRCNMAAGAQPLGDNVTDRDRAIAARLSPALEQYGLYFVGIDVIDGQLTEVNVTSPTGVREIDALTGSDLASDIVRWTESAVSQKVTAAGVSA